jgi:hypothetical protein|tara:strand:- start:134 stop:253 length:120 start_codon:yes stop_codon:yes gene_type:complete
MLIDVKNKNAIIIISNVSVFNPNSEIIDKICLKLMEDLN